MIPEMFCWCCDGCARPTINGHCAHCSFGGTEISVGLAVVYGMKVKADLKTCGIHEKQFEYDRHYFIVSRRLPCECYTADAKPCRARARYQLIGASERETKAVAGK